MPLEPAGRQGTVRPRTGRYGNSMNARTCLGRTSEKCRRSVVSSSVTPSLSAMATIVASTRAAKLLPYSALSAFTGSTRLARRAGKKAARKATAAITAGTPRKVMGSIPLTP